MDVLLLRTRQRVSHHPLLLPKLQLLKQLLIEFIKYTVVGEQFLRASVLLKLLQHRGSREFLIDRFLLVFFGPLIFLIFRILHDSIIEFREFVDSLESCELLVEQPPAGGVL